MAHAEGTDPPPSGAGSASVGDRLGPGALRIALLCLWIYLCITLVYQERVAGIAFGAAKTALLLLVGSAFLVALPGWLAARRVMAPARMLDIGVAGVITLFGVLTLDVVYTIRENATRARAQQSVSEAVRRRDNHIWHGELAPRVYFPTDRDFVLHKPNVRYSGETFGEYYHPGMLASPLLRDSVLQLRPLSYFIGQHGFRELESLAASRLFALGDSFVFGFATSEGAIWTDLLGKALGQPVFNLGVSATGPRNQLRVLEHLLETHADSLRIERLLWVIFEGNDLENSYTDALIDDSAPRFRELLAGTVPEALASLPGRLRNQSVLRRLVRKELRLAADPVQSHGGRVEVDGVSLPVPLFHSSQWGYRFFFPDDLVRATRPREYVMEHPNRPLVEDTFRQMRALSERHRFEVTVVVAPSDARVHGAAFKGFPELAPPHFIDFVVELSHQLGFRTVNLLPLLRPFAEKELLYWRDDHHWNERGNAIVAGLLAESLRQRTPDRP